VPATDGDCNTDGPMRPLDQFRIVKSLNAEDP